MFTTKEIENIYKSHADPERAKKMAAYMRNNFEFYGLPAGLRRELSKAYIKEGKKVKFINWDLLTELFSNSYREINYFGLDLLKTQSHLLTIGDFENLVGLAKIRPWWDTIDNIDSIIGGLGYGDKVFEEKILELASDDNFWLRRIAIGHQRKYKDQTDPELLAKIIEINLNILAKDKDEKFFINKAIGWALREYSKTNPAWVRFFLTDRPKLFSSLTIREASKYLD